MPSVENHDWDMADFVAIGLMGIPIVTYAAILTKQHGMLERSTYRVQVLSTRTVLFLPTYAVLVWLTLVFPGLAAAFEIPVSIAEGQSTCAVIISLLIRFFISLFVLRLPRHARRQPWGPRCHPAIHEGEREAPPLWMPERPSCFL